MNNGNNNAGARTPTNASNGSLGTKNTGGAVQGKAVPREIPVQIKTGGELKPIFVPQKGALSEARQEISKKPLMPKEKSEKQDSQESTSQAENLRQQQQQKDVSQANSARQNQARKQLNSLEGAINKTTKAEVDATNAMQGAQNYTSFLRKKLAAMGQLKNASSNSALAGKLGKNFKFGSMNPLSAAMGQLKNAGKSESEKDAFEKEEEEKQKEKVKGFGTLRVPLQVKIFLLATIPVFGFFVIFMVAILPYVADEKATNIHIAALLGNKAAQDLQEFREDLDLEGDRDFGTGPEDVLGMGTGNSTADEFTSRAKELGNIYNYFKCESIEECKKRDEVKFFIKLSDIMYRYKKKYSVYGIDWQLLMATIFSMDMDVKDTYKNFYNNYSESDVENFDITMNLDWDYDYEEELGDDYLSSLDYRYDMQLLVKNMVRKTTTQTCSKTDEEGHVTITNQRTDKDINDADLQPGKPYYLSCGSGETYSISSNYRYDQEKYDEFLLEYLEHKLYLQESGTGVIDPDNPGVNIDEDGNISIDWVEGDSLSSTMVNLALAQIHDSSAYGGRKYWMHMGFTSRVAWCAAFVSWVIDNTSYEGTSLSSIIGYTSAGVQNFANHFINASNLQFKKSDYLGGNYTPKQGDLIFFSWKDKNGACHNTGVSTMGHIGIVVKVEDGYVHTIEGNTSNRVAERKYPITSCELSGYGVWY